MNAVSHVPVLLERVLELLAPSFAHDRPVLVDATLGLGGHAEAMLTRFGDLHLIGIDRDADALERAGQRLEPFGVGNPAPTLTVNPSTASTADHDSCCNRVMRYPRTITSSTTPASSAFMTSAGIVHQ